MLKAFDGPQMMADVELSRFDSVHDTMHMLSLVMDADTCFELQLLVDHCPCTVKTSKKTTVTQQRRFIECRSDLLHIQELLGTLPDKIRH